MRSGLPMAGIVAALLFATPAVFFGAEGNVSAAVADDGDSGQSQAAASTQGGPYRASTTPRVELFLGYSYLRAVPNLSSDNRLASLHGGSTSVAYNLKPFLGLVADFGGFADSELNITGPGANPARVVDSGGSAYTYLFGPRFSYRKHERLVPFAQVLFGGVHAGQVTLDGCTGASCTALPTQNAFALTAGGGLDWKIHRHVSLRLVQGEYLMTRFADPTTGTRSMQNDVRLSAGPVLSMGGDPKALPVAYSCEANPSSVYAGDPVMVSGTALNLRPNGAPIYTWQVDGGKISGTTEVAKVDTAGLAPGNYTAQGQVSEGAKRGRFADCSAPFTVLALQPPTVSCSADPSTGHPGDSITITARGMSPQNRPLVYTYSASDGSITGNTPTAILTTTAVRPQSITVTCTVADDKGQTAAAPTTVVIVAVPPPTAPLTQKLCSINFDRDTRRPTRVDNEAKACLDDVALNIQRSSDTELALVGSGHPKDAAQRAIHTKDYLVTEKGIDASRIRLYTGSSDSKMVESILIPAGATLDKTGLTPVDTRSH